MTTPRAVPAELVPPASAGTTTRQEFNGQEIAVSGETAASSAAAHATAMVQARFIMAIKRPRNWDDVRAKILRAIERPGFAGVHGRKSQQGEAWYHKPVGDGVEGFSIRYVEEAFRHMGNLDIDPVTVFEDDEKRILKLPILDLETNLCYSPTIVVPKVVERKFLKKGEIALRTRINSLNEPVYTREATEDEVLSMQANLTSKALRTWGLRHVPGDIQAESRKRIIEIRLGDVAKDPDGARKKVIDAFAALNVLPSALKEYLGHDVATCTPMEIADLRDLHAEIKEGKTTWAAALAEALEEQGGEQPPPPPTRPGLDGLTEKLQKAAAAGTAPPPAIEKVDPKECGHAPILERLKTTPTGQAVTCPACETDLEGALTLEADMAAARVHTAAGGPEPTKGKARQGRLDG